jgi:hypothetical protein
MNEEMVRIISGVLAVLLVAVIFMRRKSKKKTDAADDF